MATVNQQPAEAGTAGVQTYSPWPFYDLFLDVPHPAASPSCPPAKIIGTLAAEGNQDNIEQELAKSMPQIARFAFPEYDQDAFPPPPPPDQAPPVNRFDQYAMQPPAFQNYTFSLTLQSGMRVHGHVRRYLPCHTGSNTRYDVGRRGERAFVILTRVTGADVIYAAVLKTIDAISSHQIAAPHHFSQDQPLKTFLHELFKKHKAIARMYTTKPLEAQNAPVFLTIQNLEVGQEGVQKFSGVDSTHFLLTPPLLIRTSMGDHVSNSSNTSILPVLRCLGVAHTLRLLCALLSERRVILISASPTRLATCCKSAIAMLAQGLLHWQHLYIPVLPPHLWQYLAAPYPYLIGILSALTSRLDRTDGLGEVLLINLDQNTMETRGIPTDKIEDRIPDLLRNMNDPYNIQQYGGNAPSASAPEMLAQDLVELLKSDKKVLNGESALASMQDTAVKATKAVKATFFKLKEKGKKYLAQKSSSYNENDVKEEEQEPAEEVNSMAPDFIYTEGCRNEMGEEEARLAFCTFFMSMIGNMRWYLAAHPGQPPQLDRQRYLQQRRAEGDGEYSTMWPLLQNFCQTQMLEEFAKLRVEEMRTRQPVTTASPLFLQFSNYHHQHKIDFNLLSIRRVSRQVLEANPSNMLQQTSARRMTMELTSKRSFEGDYNKTLADLVEQCRECSSVLYDVMSVVWIRMRDNRGLQWRHATNSLHILKNLLFHGPLAAVAEATDGLDKIRALKYYNGNRQTSICVQIRTAATQVYSLIVDRSKLFHIRRVCIIHAAMHPNAPRSAPPPRTPPPPSTTTQQTSAFNATPTFAVLPPAPSQQAAGPPVLAQQSGHDLLGLTQTPSANTDIFGVFGGGGVQQATPAPSSAGSDVLGLFLDMTLGHSGQPQQPANQYAAPQQQPSFVAGAQQGPPNMAIPQQQDYRPHSRSQSRSPPPQFSQQRPGNQYPPQQHQSAGQFAVMPQQNRSLSPTPPRSQSLSPGPQQYSQPQPTNTAYGQPSAYNATVYQAQPGTGPAFAQPPSSGGYNAQISPHPLQGYPQNQGVHPSQQQQFQAAAPYPGSQQQQMPSQQGPFF